MYEKIAVLACTLIANVYAYHQNDEQRTYKQTPQPEWAEHNL